MKGKVFDGTCAKPESRNHVAQRHLKSSKFKRSLLTSDNLILTAINGNKTTR